MTAGLDVTAAVVIAALLDWTRREPPARYHPVALFGRLVERVSSVQAGPAKPVGAFLAVALSLGAAVAVYLVVAVAALISATIAAVVAGLVLWSTSSLRMLLDIGEEAIEASDEDPERAAETLLALVGRETDDLSPPLLRSAAVESLAENLSDGLVAPLGAFAALSLVSLPAAAAGAAFVKAVNTLDSMLGYPGDFGWGSARLDDLVMFLPARISAAIIGISAGDPEAPLRARRYARLTPSPNAGWPMGTLAAALNVRLEKPGVYVLNEVADHPTLADGRAALAATRRAGIVTYGCVALVGVILWL